ncbi:double-strand break repair protein AddB [Devosia albogilva]|uniref:Double-strand break repair protein AddB n=1 Tax=Devosia albogilva TaxID=429726 RepID=A0ABW5QKJ0_9HYPH
MRLYSIAPHAPFIPTLAERVLDGTLLHGWQQEGPFWLADVTIILPTRRARLALADEFARRGHHLLPDLRTLGGEVEDEEPFLPPFDAPALPQPATALERRLVLSRLVAEWAASGVGRQAFSTPPTPAEILAMAESLGEVIDDLITEERTATDIRAVAAERSADLGEYWQQTLQFLDIALTFWPQHLGAVGRADAAWLRNQRLERQAGAAAWLFGDKPVIAAGSTGSIPATARLLGAIARLPRGAVVLPGLDTTMSATEHEDLLNAQNQPHGHPQYGLASLLRRLGATVSSVSELAEGDDTRTRLVNTALNLAKDTARWTDEKLKLTPMEIGMATAGISVIRARNEDEEARAIALAARAALADKRTVGIVSPDRNLARRIAAELKRFSIHVDDSAGTPLFQAAAGRLLRQILAVAAGGCAPVDIMALLRNRAATFGLERAAVRRLADDIELGLLRGQRAAPGLDGLRQLLADNLDETTRYPAKRLKDHHREPLEDLFGRIEAAISPLAKLMEQPSIAASDLARCLCTALEAVADGADLPGRDELGRWAAEMAAQAGEGHRFVPFGLDGVLAQLTSGFNVRTAEDRRQDIAIWGRLEARLMNPDILILAGLNEDIWPEVADPGPWLSRGMRLAAGLEPPERRQGQAAHDFVQGLGNREVTIAYAERVGSGPAQPSRLLQRLEAFVGEAGHWRDRGAPWLEQARRLDAVTEVTPAGRPAPNPPVEERPRKLSVTAIETLMRSPYDIYAATVLKLKPLDALGETAEARDRGNTVHEILSRFVIEGHPARAPDALERIMHIAEEEFGRLHVSTELRAIWLRRFETAARQFLDYESEREPLVKQRHAEIKGVWALPSGFTLTGRADRVDELADGTLELMDFKTGGVPAPGAMRAFEAPQLLLEAAMAEAGAMEGVKPAASSALTYVKIGLGPDAFSPKPFSLAEGHDVMSAAAETARRMQGHVDYFLFRETPMPARLLPVKNQRFPGAYDHLMRMQEWTAVDEDEEELW